MKMKKIAIVVQRYGEEVNGGAELHAKLIAEKLSNKYSVTILTSTAKDYIGWDNYYSVGLENINGVFVHRFLTHFFKFTKLKRLLLRFLIYGPEWFFSHNKIKKMKFFLPFLNAVSNKLVIKSEDFDELFKIQGPYCPDLISHIKMKKDEYDVFIFYSYLYYPSAVGMPIVKDKSIFIPLAHDEPELKSKYCKYFFTLPKFIMYLTTEEKKLVEERYPYVTKKSNISGVGVSVDENFDVITNDTLYADSQYFVYIGRIDKMKMCDVLVDWFEAYAKDKNIKLIMIGSNFANIIESDKIILSGFLSDCDKNLLLKNSLGLIMPSKFESLSMVVLEAMAVGKNVVVNGDCKVLKDHIVKCGAGFYYHGYSEFCDSLDSVINMSNLECNNSIKKYKKYIKDFYSWDIIMGKFDESIAFILGE